MSLADTIYDKLMAAGVDGLEIDRGSGYGEGIKLKLKLDQSVRADDCVEAVFELIREGRVGSLPLTHRGCLLQQGAGTSQQIARFVKLTALRTREETGSQLCR